MGPGRATPPMKYTGRLRISRMLTVAVAPFTVWAYIRDSCDARRANNITIRGTNPLFGFVFDGNGKNKLLIPDPH